MTTLEARPEPTGQAASVEYMEQAQKRNSETPLPGVIPDAAILYQQSYTAIHHQHENEIQNLLQQKDQLEPNQNQPTQHFEVNPSNLSLELNGHVIEPPNQQGAEMNNRDCKTNHEHYNDTSQIYSTEETLNNAKPSNPTLLASASSTSNYEQWCTDFTSLIEDDEGAPLFYKYLESEQNNLLYDCWQSCVEYKSYPPNKATAKEIYSHYIRQKDPRVPVSDQARNNLQLRLRANDIREDLLQEVESEMFINLRDVCYLRFLKSDFFRSYCEQRGLSFNPMGMQSAMSSCKQKYSGSLSALPEDETASFAESNPSGGSKSHRYKQPALQECNHDTLPNLANFKPRTQRMTQEKQMTPADFARVLTEKLERVIEERRQLSERQQAAETETRLVNAAGPSVSHAPISNPLHSEASVCESDALSYTLPFDRFSVAGQSSHSGSGVNPQADQKYKGKAKELAYVIKHSLKGTLNECNCQACIERNRPAQYPVNYAGYHQPYPVRDVQHASNCCTTHQAEPPSAYRQSHLPQQQQPCCCSRNKELSYGHNPRLHTLDEQPIQGHNTSVGVCTVALAPAEEVIPAVDNSKILQWMEKNEQYSNEKFSNPSPSPAPRRKSKQPVQYNTSRPAHRTTPQVNVAQPIASDPGMPPLPPPNTSTVLEEAKRRLQDGSSQQSTLRRQAKNTPSHPNSYAHQPTSQGQNIPSHKNFEYVHHENESIPVDGSRDGSRAYSDSHSSVSYNPPLSEMMSEISTVPSSASRLWNSDARSDIKSEPRHDYRSEIRSEPRAGHRIRTEAHGGSYSEPRSVYHMEPRGSHRNVHRKDPRALKNDHRTYQYDHSNFQQSTRSYEQHDNRVYTQQLDYSNYHQYEHNLQQDPRLIQQDPRLIQQGPRLIQQGESMLSHHGNMPLQHEPVQQQDPSSKYHSDLRQVPQHDSRLYQPQYISTFQTVDYAQADFTHHPARSDASHRSEAKSHSSTGRSGGSGSSRTQKNTTSVTYYFGVDPIPFRITIPTLEVTLGQFKDQTKRGNFRYFFKTLSEEDGEIVFEEIKHDNDLLPRFQDKVVGKVMKNE